MAVTRKIFQVFRRQRYAGTAAGNLFYPEGRERLMKELGGATKLIVHARVYDRSPAGSPSVDFDCREGCFGEEPPGHSAIATGRTFTLRALLEALRHHGVVPTTRSADDDEAWATGILTARAVSRGVQTPEEAGSTHPALGLAEGLFVRTTPVAGGTSSAFQYFSVLQVGDYDQMLRETAAMKASRVRRCGHSETSWAAIFPYDEDLGDLHQHGLMYRKPSDILAELEADGYARLGAVASFLIACLTSREGPIRADLTLFNGMAGMTKNYSPSRAGALGSVIDLYDNWPRPDGITYGDVAAGKPSWQLGFLLPSGDGWDPFYYEPTSGGFSGTGGTAAEQTYQQFATNVWPTARGQAGASAYAKAGARRKCLGLAAFAYGIGKWLAGLDRAMRAAGAGTIYDVVDHLEVANEPDQFWVLPSTAATQAEAQAAIHEVGRYVALLAGPVRHWLPSMRFRVELMSWFDPNAGNASTHVERTQFLARVLTEGLTAETDWWATIEGARHAAQPPVDVADWQATEALAGFQWPPTGVLASARGRMTPRDLVHQVGYHHYHGFNAKDRGQSYTGYLAAEGTAQEAREFVATMDTLPGLNLTSTVGEVGFPAIDPGPDPARGYYVANTSEKLQAAMLLRLSLVLLASGIEHVKAFTFNYGFPTSFSAWPQPNFTGWDVFYTNGVHNDVYWSLGSPSPSFQYPTDCWPRPAWYTWRRLAWLLSHTDATFPLPTNVQIVCNVNGLTVVELTFARLVATGPDGAPLTRGWPRAYVLWLDQYCDDPTYFPTPWTTNAVAHFAFDEAQQATFPDALPGFEAFPMVPQTAEPTGAVNARGYAEPASVDWAWAGWGEALVRSDNPVEFLPLGPDATIQRHRWRLEVEIQKCAPDSSVPSGGVALAPVCIFTSAVFTHAD